MPRLCLSWLAPFPWFWRAAHDEAGAAAALVVRVQGQGVKPIRRWKAIEPWFSGLVMAFSAVAPRCVATAANRS